MVKKFNIVAVLLSVGCLASVLMIGEGSQPVGPVPPPQKPPDKKVSFLQSIGIKPKVTVRSDATSTAPYNLSNTTDQHGTATAETTKSPFNESLVSDHMIAVGGQRYPLRSYRALMTPN